MVETEPPAAGDQHRQLNIDEIVVDRDADGDVVPQTREITWRGETREVEVRPLTPGHLEEYGHNITVLKDGLEFTTAIEVLQRHYIDPELLRWPAQTFYDLPAAQFAELLSAFGLEPATPAAGDGGKTDA